MKAASLLNHLARAKKTPPPEAKVATPEADVLRPNVVTPAKRKAPVEPEKVQSKTKFVEIEEKELYIQQVIVKNRSKLLWPGIWTIFAVAGTYGALAYLDAKFSTPLSIETTVLERATIPQSWYLTPSVMKEGVIAGWNELDKLTIGIVAASIGIHFLKKSPLPIWERFIHITGEKKYTAFLYPYVHSGRLHLSMNMWGLCWFLPGVVHHFQGDLFHAAAFFTTVPLITSYLQHFVFRFTSVPGIPLNVGSSGAIAALIGAFCMLYPDEKVWTPNFLVFRLDAKYVASLFAAWQIASMVNLPKGGNRPASLVSLIKVMLEPRAD
jgi:membrane associated rhomboid family serine protease